MDAKLFAAGDGDVIEDAPLGYYRFHYWKTDQQPKEHDNYMGTAKGAGPVCVSVVRGAGEAAGSSYYRLLVRTKFVGGPGACGGAEGWV